MVPAVPVGINIVKLEFPPQKCLYLQVRIYNLYYAGNKLWLRDIIHTHGGWYTKINERLNIKLEVSSPLLQLDFISFSAPHLLPCKECAHHMQILIQNNQVSIVAKVEPALAVADPNSGGRVQRGSLQCLCCGATCIQSRNKREQSYDLCSS